MRSLRTATVELVEDLLIVRVRADLHQTIDDARANIAACEEAVGATRPRLLLDITRALPLDPEVRHYYAGPVVVRVCSALALLVETSPLGRMFGNVYLRVANPGVPTRVFDREAAAVAWLRARRVARPPSRVVASSQ